MKKCPKCSQLLPLSSFKYEGINRYSVKCKNCLRFYRVTKPRRKINRGLKLKKEETRNRTIKRLRNSGISLEEIGKEFGISRQRVHQIVGRGDTLYIIKCNEFYKVGITYNPERRIREFENGNPYPLSIIIEIPTHDAIRLEKEIHALLKTKNHRGEWFKDLSPKDILKIKTFLVKENGFVRNLNKQTEISDQTTA